MPSTKETPQAAVLQATDRKEKRAGILSAAVRLFNEQGYYDTRLEDVAARVGATKTSISYYFHSKEALLFEAYAETCTFAEAEIRLAASAPTGLERLVRWIRAYAQGQSAAILGNRAPLATISDPSALGAHDKELIGARLQAHATALLHFIRDGLDDGSVRISSPSAGVFLLLSMQQWMRRWLQNVVPTSHDAAIDAVCDLLRHGLVTDRARVLRQARPSSTADTEDYLFGREARNKMKREAFLRTGTRHFNRWGYRNLSLNDVTSELGVSRGVFYYHFKDRDALLDGCAGHTLDAIERALLTHQNPALGGAGRLFMMLTALYDGHLTDLNPLLRLSLFSSLGSREKTLAMARFRRVTAGIGEMIAHGMADGSIRIVDLEAAEYLMSGVVFGATQHRLRLFGIGAAMESGALAAPCYFEPLFYGLSATGPRSLSA